MYSLLRHIAAVCLSALVLLSTISFTVDMHYCGKHLVDIAFNDDARGCGMAMDSNLHSEGDEMMGMPCCEDVQLAYDGQEDIQSAYHQFNLEKQAEFLAQPGITEVFLPLIEISNIPYREYSPPPIIQDIPVLYQSFLI